MQKTDINGSYQYILCFEKEQEKLGKIIPNLISVLQTNEQLWIAYPKGSSKRYKSNLNREIIRSIIHHNKFNAVSLIAIDDNWSAMRVKPMELIKSGKK